MTNNPINQTENECIGCQAYQQFKALAKTEDIKEAFHVAMDFVIESLVDDLADSIGEDSYAEGHSDGFDDGFVVAHKTMAEQLAHTSEILNEELNSPCDDCDCETADECQADAETVEDKIRRAIRED